MPHMVAKFGDDAYAEWSTVVDAPISPIFDRPTAVAAFGPDRVDRADEHITSHHEYRLKEIQELFAGDKAGDDETELDLAGILEKYSLDTVQGSTRLIAVCDLVFIRDADGEGPYLLKSRTTPGGFVSDSELERLIDAAETVLELRKAASSWNMTAPTIVKDERGFIADATY